MSLILLRTLSIVVMLPVGLAYFYWALATQDVPADLDFCICTLVVVAIFWECARPWKDWRAKERLAQT
jgi:hypothetical protein